MIALDLSSRTILITGALGAIAEFINRRLLEGGARLILTDVVPEPTAQLRLEAMALPTNRWLYRQMDVTDPDMVSRATAAMFSELPTIDVLLGHAGGCALHPFASTSADEFERIVQFNFLGQIHVTRAVLREWVQRKTGGHIIYTSSLVGSLPWVDLTAYTASKAALEMFARCLALEHAACGIRCNCVAPGHVAAGSSLKVYEADPVYRRMVDRVIPLGRLIRPEAIADVFAWLCSPMADDVNGQVIRIDGGASIPKVG